MAIQDDGQLDVLFSDTLKARIVKLEYGSIDSNGEFIPISVDDIRRIYIEETGMEPPNKITLYRSDDFKSSGRDSGFDGTVIHFYDPEKGVNEIYTIPRGSEKVETGGAGDGQPLDWIYNGLGIFTGKVNDQLEDAQDFEEWASDSINRSIGNDIKHKEHIPELRKIGLGHSLGGNHIQMIYLLGGEFDSVYALNDAAPTVYQLAGNDADFFREIQIVYGKHIKQTEDLFTLDPKQLQSFALNYYQSKGVNIHHITSEEDALYPLHLTRGFLRLGDEHVVDTNPNLSGLHSVIERIPDKQLQALQKYLAAAAPYYEEAGMDGLFHYATGIDNRFLQNLNVLITGDYEAEGSIELKNIAKFTFFHPFKAAKNRYTAFIEVKNQLPIIQKRLTELVQLIPVLIVIADSMTGEEGQQISDYLRSIQQRAEKVLTAIVALSTFDITSLKGFKDSVKGIMFIAQELKGVISDLHLLWASGKELIANLLGSGEAHGLEALLNGLSQTNRHYSGNDLIYRKGDGASIIEINISSASRLYWIGQDNYEKKRLVLERIQQAYIQKFEQPYDFRKQDLLSKISDMESNPHAYSHLLGGGDREMVGISVRESIPPMPSQITNNINGIQRFYEADIEKGKRLFSQMKDAILQLFSEDQQLTAIFELR